MLYVHSGSNIKDLRVSLEVQIDVFDLVTNSANKISNDYWSHYPLQQYMFRHLLGFALVQPLVYHIVQLFVHPILHPYVLCTSNSVAINSSNSMEIY